MLRRFLRHSVIKRGMRDVAKTILPANASESKIEAEAEKQFGKRYEFMRDLAIK